MIPEIEKQNAGLEKTKSRIEIDVLNKQEAIQREEFCASINTNSFSKVEGQKKKKKRFPNQNAILKYSVNVLTIYLVKLLKLRFEITYLISTPR